MSGTPIEEAKRQSWWQLLKSCSGTKQDRKNQYVFTAWTFAWAISYVMVTKLLKSDYALPELLKWLAVAVPVVLSIKTYTSYMHFLRQADELLQKIQMEGLAIGFGVGVFATLVYPLFEQLGAPEMQVNNLVVVMMFGWVAGQLIAMRQFR